MRISVIIPARDEAQNLAFLLADLRAMNGAIHEIIVCDGGSRDETVEVARCGGARVLACDVGNRGAQMNAGARLSGGDVLWFLHADARLSVRAANSMQKAMGEAASTRAELFSRETSQSDAMAEKIARHATRQVAASTRASHFRAQQTFGGNFVLRFEDKRIAARVFESIARVQRRGGVYYGDSGIFVRRETFEELGGFRAWPLFEDLDFARRLEHLASTRGAKTVCLRPPIRASSRRFARNPWKLLATWALLQTLFQLGVSPHKLAKIYHRQRE